MSLYLVPIDFYSAGAAAHSSRCAAQQQDRRHRSNLTPFDDIASALYGFQDDVRAPHLHAQAQARLRRQQLQEQYEREMEYRRLAALQRQRELQQRQQREAARRRAVEMAKFEAAAAASAYFSALMEQRQLEAQHQRRREVTRAKQAHAQRIKAAYQQQVQQLLEASLAKQACQEAHEQKRQNQQEEDQQQPSSFEDVISDLFGGFAQLFGGAFEQQPHQSSQKEQPSTVDQGKDKGKAKEKNDHLPSVPEQSEPVDVDMVDPPAPASSAAPEAASTSITTEAKSTEAQPEAVKEHFYTHPVPAPKDFDIASLNLSVDTASNQVRISGLWPSAIESSSAADSVRSASPTLSAHSRSSSSSARERGRSPRRSHVADVDENGEEIITPELLHDENEEDFVDLGATALTTSQKEENNNTVTIDLPRHADVDSLRADLTDAGLELYVKRRPQPQPDFGLD